MGLEKHFLQKNTLQIGAVVYFIIDLNNESNVETYYKKSRKRQIKQSLELKKLSKNETNSMSKGKAVRICLVVG